MDNPEQVADELVAMMGDMNEPQQAEQDEEKDD